MRAVVIALFLLAGLSPAAAAADASWRLEQPAPPEGAPFKVPLGAPGDLKFWSPSRGLLAVEGNAVSPRGLWYWNGRVWRTLSTVCGGSADTLRIAWAGPTEWWTVSEPSRPRIGSGTTLCRYVGGVVVASYGTLPASADPYRLMTSATCRSASDCWFGGPAASDPTGSRVGAFRLHWNGGSLTTSYGPQGRAISDLQAHAGVVYESSLVGPRAEDRTPAVNRESEKVPALLRRVGESGQASLDPFTPIPLGGVPADGTELLALDSDGQQLWAGGGGAASGPAAPADGVVARPPMLARMAPGESTFREITPIISGATAGPTDRVGDLAAIPGTASAMLALQPFTDRRSTNAKAKVGRIDAATGELKVTTLPASGAGRGTAAKVACPSTTECWMATAAGWLFHYTDGQVLPADSDPAFSKLITVRPNEAAAQFIPDTPPVDDSQLLAPPPVETPVVAAPVTTTKQLEPVLKGVKSRLRGLTLEISFRVVRRAKIAVIGKRRGKVVARTKLVWLKPGKRTLKLKLNRKRWPTKLSFTIVDPAAPAIDDTGDDDAILTARRAGTSAASATPAATR